MTQLNTATNLSGLIPAIISKDIELMSIEQGFRQFRNFGVVKTDLKGGPGSTITIPKLNDLGDAQDLTEASTLKGSGKKISIGSLSLTPTEHGDEVQWSEYSALVSQNDVKQIVTELLARQSSRKENLDIRDTLFNATQIRYTGTSGASVATQALVTGGLHYKDIDYAVEELEAAECAKFPGESLIAFIHPYAKTSLRDGLRSTSDYIHSVPALYKGEIGMYNRTRFIESAYAPFRAFVKTAPAIAGAVIASVDAALVEDLSNSYADTASWELKWVNASSYYRLYNATTAQYAQFLIDGAAADSFTVAQITAAAIVVLGSGTTIEAQTSKSPFSLKKAGLTLVETPGADDKVTFAIQRNVCTKIIAPRHYALAVSKKASMLGVEPYDYGRTIGVAWNAFYDSAILNNEYGWVIESKR